VTQSWSYDDRGRAVGTSVIRGGSIASTALKYGGDDVPRVRTRSLGSYVATDLYKADGIGRVIGDSLAIPGTPTIPGSGAGNVRDVSNEDVQAAWSATAPGSSLTFDGASNWTSRSGTNAFTPTIDSMNRYASIGADIVQYDSLGRISSYRDETYGFNADGRLMSATKDRASTQYWYDGEGRRKAEQRDGHMTAFVWDGDRIIATVPDKDVSLARIRLGAGSDDTLALVDGFGSGAARFIHADVDGSTIAATNSSGMLLEAYAYSAYGETTFLDAGGRPLGASTFNNRFLFQGQLYDPQLGAYSMRAREYKPVWGRFLSPDPAGIAFSDNRYAFVDGRPLTMADPSGLAQVNGLYQQAWASSYSWGSTGALDDHYRGKFGLTSRYAAEMAGVRSTATRANWAKGNYGLVAINASLGAIDVFGVTVLGNNTRQTIEKVATGIVVGGAVGTFFKWAAGTAPLWTPLASSGASAAGTTIGAGAGVVGADAVMTSGLAGDISVADSIAAEVDAAFSSERVQSGTMIEFTDAKGPLSGSGPKNGNGDIWFHDNITVPDGGPGGAAAKIRTHSPNPNAPVGTFSSTNYTTQINTSSGLYRLPDGTWKPLSDMTPAELSLAHIPAGN
ncbi:MAG: hypothetical protein JWM53_5817, partial [bacterium]|nr:hypothetical protein [bacterium]